MFLNKVSQQNNDRTCSHDDSTESQCDLFKNGAFSRGTWLAQQVKRATLELRVVRPSPTMGVEMVLRK